MGTISADEPPPPVGEAVITYDGTSCTYDGPANVPAGRMGFRFDSDDPTWVAVVCSSFEPGPLLIAASIVVE